MHNCRRMCRGFVEGERNKAFVLTLPPRQAEVLPPPTIFAQPSSRFVEMGAEIAFQKQKISHHFRRKIEMHKCLCLCTSVCVSVRWYLFLCRRLVACLCLLSVVHVWVSASLWNLNFNLNCRIPNQSILLVSALYSLFTRRLFAAKFSVTHFQPYLKFKF